MHQEETDTKMVLHALDAISNGANEWRIHSLVTGGLVLSIRCCLELCGKASFVNGTGQNHRVIELGSISSATGRARLAVLPTFHAPSGADITGSFLENLRAGKPSETQVRTSSMLRVPWNDAVSRRQSFWSRIMFISFISPN